MPAASCRCIERGMRWEQPLSCARRAGRARPLAHRRLRLWRGLRGSARAVDADRRTLAAARQRCRHGRAHQGAGDVLRRTRPARHSPSADGRASARQRRQHGLPRRSAAPAAVISCRAGWRRADPMSISSSGSRAAPSRRCSSAMAAARACSASASNGPRPRREARGAMAARSARPSLPQAIERQMASAVDAHRPRLPNQGPRLRRFPGRVTARPCCSRSIRGPAPRSTYSTAAQRRFYASMCDAVKRASLPPAD